MEEVKYVPGDLVMTDGAPIGAKKGVAYLVTASNPDRALTLESGEVLKGTITLDNIKGKDFKDNGYLFGDSSAWVKHIVPIPLTSAILEANGWSKSPVRPVDFCDIYRNIGSVDLRYDNKTKTFYFDDMFVVVRLPYVHDLQHLLFGLGLNSELKV